MHILEKMIKEIYPKIGKLTLTFNALEETLGHSLVGQINIDNKKVGNIIIKDYTFLKKIKLFKELAVNEIDNELKNIKVIKEIKDDLNKLCKNLDTVRIERNDIIHASWLSLNEKSEIKTIKKKAKKITAQDIEKISTFAMKTTSQIFYFSKKLFKFEKEELKK